MKRKIKTFTSILVIISLLCIITGCAHNSKSDIVGKWYNEKNKCLNIRSDGTYKLEDSYGTGTWKLLDDNKTYEFLDYYGDSQESVINTDDLGIYIDFGYYGNFYKDSYPSTNVQNNVEKNDKETDIQILKCSAFKNFYKVEFQKADKAYCGFADASGQIFYYTDNYSSKDWSSGNVDFKSMSENSGCLCEHKDDRTIYTIINTEGSVKTFDDDDFDKILGYGGDYILVYKNTGDISKEEHSYGLINGKGEWEIALTPGTKIPDDKTYVYFGEKVFIHEEYSFNAYRSIVFNCAKNITIEFNDCSIMSTAIHDNKFIMKCNGTFSDYCTPYGSKSNELDGYYMFSTDGSYKKIKYVGRAFDKIATYTKSDYIQIWDLETNSVAQYDDFPGSSIIDISFVNKFGLLCIQGLDDNTYFTIIDANGKQQFEPRICAYTSDMDFSGDRTIYKNQNNYYEMIDNKGNIIISEDKQCTSLKIVGETVIGRTANSDDLYFDKNGQEITFYLSKKLK